MAKTIKNVIVYGLIVVLAVAVGVLSFLLLKKDGSDATKIKFDYAYTNQKIGNEDVSVKFISKTQALVICEGQQVYFGTYKQKGDTVLITVKEEVASSSEVSAPSEQAEFQLQLSMFGKTSVLEDVSTKAKLIDAPVALTKEKDCIFQNGLWKLKIDYFSGKYRPSHENGYILKLDDNTVYAHDTSTDSSVMRFYKIGSKIYYEYVRRDGTAHHYDLFYVEKAGTHCDQINALGDFGDLIYTVEGAEERYYHALEEDTEMDLGEQFKLKATMMSKMVDGDETPINVTLAVSINKNGTVDLAISGNTEFNIITTGVWHSLADGVVIVTKDSGFFGKYFAIDLDKERNEGVAGLSYVEVSDEIEYCISWNKI